jgi:hypothetical protein
LEPAAQTALQSSPTATLKTRQQAPIAGECGVVPASAIRHRKGVPVLPTADSLAGKPVPKVSFKTRADNGWRDLTTDELFKDKTVVVFSLPGAYTPTCSSSHDISQDQKINTSVLRTVSGRITWPQVFIGGRLIGGADELEACLATAAA